MPFSPGSTMKMWPRLVRHRGAVVYMIFSLCYAALCAALMARPVYVHLTYVYLGHDLYGPAVSLSYAGLLLITVGCSIIPMMMGVRALKRLET